MKTLNLIRPLTKGYRTHMASTHDALMDMASLDSMDSDEFDAFSAAFLQKISQRRDDRRAKLGLTPKTYVELELGDVEAKKRIANRRGSMAGSLDPDQARANIENLHVAVLKVLGWAGADKDNIEELAEQFDSVVANYVDLVEAISAWFDKSVPTQGMTEEQKEGFKLFLISVARRNLLAKKMVWRLLTNTGIVYIALGALAKKEHYLSLTTGMTGYGASLGVVVVGLAMFLMSCDTNFDRSLFWKAKSGKQHVRECWRSETIWTTKRKSKDAEIWRWFAHIHPIFFPFGLLTPWICEELFEKYGNEGVERPEWMNEENNGKFIKRVVEIYIWKGGVVGAKVDVALAKLFGRNGADLEAGVDGKLSFIQSKKSRKGIKVNKVQPEELAV
ncbi:hypothetical protein TL16_g08174 [Triparma laevis f. inornata]|uniref:Uncharacterized protein n=1 Tax=Triparma laevis f. inornata TaxID=1714386 RepID=A0A9W7AZT4_9STRA|nr:hypothetical protein TL16_g08174 [Triparma laevis f. inornata]